LISFLPAVAAIIRLLKLFLRSDCRYLARRLSPADGDSHDVVLPMTNTTSQSPDHNYSSLFLLIIFTISNPNSLPCVQYRTTKCSFMNTNQVIMLGITSKKVQAHGRRLYPDYR
jgi:hypothetical protein